MDDSLPNHTAPLVPPAPSAASADARRHEALGPAGVRSTDLEPYTGLRYLSTLFRIMAVILLLVLVAEVAMGLASQGTSSLPTVIGEASRLVVLAGVLWGTGDLATLLIDVGHDVRATRILLHRQAGQPGTEGAPGENELVVPAGPSAASAQAIAEPYSTMDRMSKR